MLKLQVKNENITWAWKLALKYSGHWAVLTCAFFAPKNELIRSSVLYTKSSERKLQVKNEKIAWDIA
jgi:hypothetical protein